jgi:hypothetical protein
VLSLLSSITDNFVIEIRVTVGAKFSFAALGFAVIHRRGRRGGAILIIIIIIIGIRIRS